MNEPKICIICREIKETFSREHVFPETIGGDWVIHSVCSTCNTWLGKHIDEPFVNSPSISIERVSRQISRGGRKIKNPFAKKTYETPDKRKFAVGFSPDGGLQAEFLPHTFIDFSSGIPIGKVSYPTKWHENDPEGLEKFKQKFTAKFEKDTGYKIQSIVSDIVPSSDSQEVTVIEKNNHIIFGCLKIAYEATATLIPEYLDDVIGTRYARMLRTAEPDREYLSYYNPIGPFVDTIRQFLNEFPVASIYQLAAIIFNVPNVGLVCSVRAFGVFYPIIMSSRLDYMDNRVVMLLNDSQHCKSWYTLFKRPMKGTVIVDENTLTNDQKIELAEMQVTKSNHFQDDEGRSPVFDKERKQIASHTDEMVSLYNLIHTCPAAKINTWQINAKANQYYMLSKKSNSYFKVHTIYFEFL